MRSLSTVQERAEPSVRPTGPGVVLAYDPLGGLSSLPLAGLFSLGSHIANQAGLAAGRVPRLF